MRPIVALSSWPTFRSRCCSAGRCDDRCEERSMIEHSSLDEAVLRPSARWRRLGSRSRHVGLSWFATTLYFKASTASGETVTLKSGFPRFRACCLSSFLLDSDDTNARFRRLSVHAREAHSSWTRGDIVYQRRPLGSLWLLAQSASVSGSGTWQTTLSSIPTSPRRSAAFRSTTR